MTNSSSLILKLHIPSQRICKCVVVGHEQVGSWTGWFESSLAAHRLSSTRHQPEYCNRQVSTMPNPLPRFPCRLASLILRRQIHCGGHRDKRRNRLVRSLKAHQSTNLLGFVCLMTHQITKHNTDIFQSRSACSPNMHGRQ